MVFPPFQKIAKSIGNMCISCLWPLLGSSVWHYLYFCIHVEPTFFTFSRCFGHMLSKKCRPPRFGPVAVADLNKSHPSTEGKPSHDSMYLIIYFFAHASITAPLHHCTIAPMPHCTIEPLEHSPPSRGGGKTEETCCDVF